MRKPVHGILKSWKTRLAPTWLKFCMKLVLSAGVVSFT